MRLSMVEYNENSYTLQCNSGGPVFLKLAETAKLLVDFFYLGFNFSPADQHSVASQGCLTSCS